MIFEEAHLWIKIVKLQFAWNVLILIDVSV